MACEIFAALRIMMFLRDVAPFSREGRHTAYIFRFSPNGDSLFLRNVGTYRIVYTAPNPRSIVAVILGVLSSILQVSFLC